MGSDFVSREEAAKLLKRSERSVVYYVKNGLLRSERVGRRMLIPKEDIEALLEEIGTNQPAMNRKTFYQLVARVQRLEMTSAVLQKATGLGASPLRPTNEEAKGLHTAAYNALQAKSWGSEELHVWADMYEKMDEVFFDIVGASQSITDGWRPFYTLCIAQVRHVSEQAGFTTNIHLQQLHDRLRLAMKQMRGMVLAWIEAGGGTALSAMEPKSALLNRLAEKTGSSLG